MGVDLRNIERRPSRYWYADGIHDLVVGGLMALGAGLWLIGLGLPRRPSIWLPFWILMPAALTALMLAEMKIIRGFKERITDPRTGRIELRGPSWKVRLAGRVFSLLLVCSIAYSVATGKGLATLPLDSLFGYWLPALLGIAFGVSGLYSRPYLLLSVICLAAAVIGYLRGYGFMGFLWTLVAVGLAQAVLGLFRLRRYIKAHPRPAEVE